MADMQKMEPIPVYMEKSEAELFLQFQQYHDVFALLVERRVFEQRSAAITLHFDNKGHLRTIARADVLFSDKTDFTNTN